MSDEKVRPIVSSPVQTDEPGVAKIKREFLLLDHKPTVDTEYVSDKVKAKLQLTDDGNKSQEDKSSEGEPPAKKIKLTGRNKKRPKGKRIEASDKICPAIARDQTCSYGDKCKFSHDKQKFMDAKPADISNQCYMFQVYGKCPFGLSCRFGSAHISNDLKNIIKDDFDEAKLKATVKNVLKKENQVLLWKRKYSFTKADTIIDEMGCRNPKEKQRNKDQKKNKEKSVDNIKSDTNIMLNGVSVDTGSLDSHSTFNSKGDNADCKAGEENNDNDVKLYEDSDKIRNENSESRLTISPQANKSLTLSDTEKVTKDVKDGVADHTDIMNIQTGIVTKENDCDKAGTNSQDNSGAVGIDNGKDNNLDVASHTAMFHSKDIVHLRPQEKKKVNFADKLYLAPLTTVGNLPFRRICKRLGADITCGEMALATNLLQGQASEWALLKRHETEDLFGVQICGAYPDTMTRCAQIINDTLDVDFVDINCGCPIDLIFNKGEGSALMGRVSKFEHIVKGMTSVLDVPLTVKLRTGIYSDKNIAHTLVPKLRDWGVALTTVHGRSRVQRYTKTADWDYISECAKLAGPMPLFGNGDILSFVDANERREMTGVSGIMIARGALIKPWIFTEIKEQRHWDISANERFDILRDYTNYGLEHWGSDQQGVESTRRFLLEWLSFLYRYIPVGLLERVPHKINERPPYYRGRNDLETLMASPNCGDWIKISEMLLGPVPEGFSFLPKHKANAYK